MWRLPKDDHDKKVFKWRAWAMKPVSSLINAMRYDGVAVPSRVTPL